MPVGERPPLVVPVVVFFVVATLILLSVGTALISPGSPQNAIWRLNPERRALLMPYRLWLGPTFLTLAVVMVAASAGCFLRRHWGWVLRVAVFVGQVLGDVVQLLMGRYLEGAIGVAAGATLLIYLCRLVVRKSFA